MSVFICKVGNYSIYIIAKVYDSLNRRKLAANFCCQLYKGAVFCETSPANTVRKCVNLPWLLASTVSLHHLPVLSIHLLTVHKLRLCLTASLPLISPLCPCIINLSALPTADMLLLSFYKPSPEKNPNSIIKKNQIILHIQNIIMLQVFPSVLVSYLWHPSPSFPIFSRPSLPPGYPSFPLAFPLTYPFLLSSFPLRPTTCLYMSLP